MVIFYTIDSKLYYELCLESIKSIKTYLRDGDIIEIYVPTYSKDLEFFEEISKNELDVNGVKAKLLFIEFNTKIEDKHYWTKTCYLKYLVLVTREAPVLLYLDTDILFSRNEKNLSLEEQFLPYDGKINFWTNKEYNELNSGIILSKNAQKLNIDYLSIMVKKRIYGVYSREYSYKEYEQDFIKYVFHYFSKLGKNFFSLKEDSHIQIYFKSFSEVKEESFEEVKEYFTNSVFHFVNEKTQSTVDLMKIANKLFANDRQQLIEIGTEFPKETT